MLYKCPLKISKARERKQERKEGRNEGNKEHVPFVPIQSFPKRKKRKRNGTLKRLENILLQ